MLDLARAKHSERGHLFRAVVTPTWQDADPLPLSALCWLVCVCRWCGVYRGGLAGLALAARLSENANMTVAVIEAGSSGDETDVSQKVRPTLVSEDDWTVLMPSCVRECVRQAGWTGTRSDCPDSRSALQSLG